MYKITDITEKYGLSKRQVRYRLTQLDDLLSGHMSTGKNQAKLVDDYGMSLFDRLMELENNGRATSSAVNIIRAEIGDNIDDKDTGKGNEGSVEDREVVVKQLEARIEDLKQHNQELKEQLDRKDKQLQQLLPATGQEKLEASPWELFKNWLFEPR